MCGSLFFWVDPCAYVCLIAKRQYIYMSHWLIASKIFCFFAMRHVASCWSCNGTLLRMHVLTSFQNIKYYVSHWLTVHIIDSKVAMRYMDYLKLQWNTLAIVYKATGHALWWGLFLTGQINVWLIALLSGCISLQNGKYFCISLAYKHRHKRAMVCR